MDGWIDLFSLFLLRYFSRRSMVENQQRLGYRNFAYDGIWAYVDNGTGYRQMRHGKT